MTHTQTVSNTTTIRSQLDTLIVDLTTNRHPALGMARNVRNIAQAAADGKATNKHLDGLRLLRKKLVDLHNSSHLNGFRLFCRRLANLIDRLGIRMQAVFGKQTQQGETASAAPQAEQPVDDGQDYGSDADKDRAFDEYRSTLSAPVVAIEAPQVNVKPRDLLAEATAARATAREVACACAE